MAFAPFSQRDEASLLLDRNKVAVTAERIAVSSAVYTGRDDDGRSFSIAVRQAVQRSTQQPLIVMSDLSATIQLSGGFAQIKAPEGEYDYEKGVIRIAGPVEIDAPNGYRLVTRGLTVDLRQRSLQASHGVAGTVSSGNFSADALSVDLDSRTITLDGHAHLRMTPGRLLPPR